MAPGPTIPPGSTIVLMRNPLPFSPATEKNKIEEGAASQGPKQFLLQKMRVAEMLGKVYLKGAGNLLSSIQISAEMYLETKQPKYKEIMMESFIHIQNFYNKLSPAEVNSYDETRIIMKNFDYVKKLSILLKEFEVDPSEGKYIAIKDYINNINMNGKQLTVNFEKVISVIRQEKEHSDFVVPLVDYKGGKWQFPYR